MWKVRITHKDGSMTFKEGTFEEITDYIGWLIEGDTKKIVIFK